PALVRKARGGIPAIRPHQTARTIMELRRTRPLRETHLESAAPGSSHRSTKAPCILLSKIEMTARDSDARIPHSVAPAVPLHWADSAIFDAQPPAQLLC